MSDQFPSLWRTVELRQIASFVSGGTPSRKDERYFKGTIPWLTGYDLPEDRVVDVFEGRELITDEAVRESATTPVEAGTVLLTTRVTVGKVAIARTRLCFSQDVTGIIIENTNVITPEFLAYYLLATRELLLRRNRGSTIQGVIRRDVERLQIPIPPLSEQQRIVEILNQADELRQVRDQANARIGDLQASLFYEMFGNPFTNTKHWPVVELHKVAFFVSGGTPDRKTEAYFQGEIPWLTGYDLPEDKVIEVYDGREYITQEAINNSASNLIEPETVLLTTRVTVGKVAIAKTRLCFSQDVTGIVIKNQNILTPLYLAYYLLLIRELLLHRNRGSTIQGIIRRDLERLQIPIPHFDLQQVYIRRLIEISTTLEIQNTVKLKIEELINAAIGSAFTGEFTFGWRETNIGMLHDEAVSRDIALGLRFKEPRLIDLRRGQVTQAEREQFEQAMREDFQPAVKQLLDSFSPVAQAITQGPLLRLSELVTPALPNFKDLIDACLSSQINGLNEAARNALAATVQPIVEIQQHLAEQITAQQRELFNVAEMMARIAADIVRRPDESHPRYPVLRALSDEQYWIYLAIRQQTGYFTAQSLSDEEDFPFESVRRALPLFESLGLIMRISVAMSPNSEDLYFIDAYRKPKDADDSRSSAIETFRKFIDEPSKTSPMP